MSSPVRYQPIAAPASQRTEISQATAVEQSRAIAEVQAAVLVAQQNRRSKPNAIAEMVDSTSQLSVAEKAFFSFPRGGKNVTGPSVHLARELARCWGNIQYGITELRRDDDKGESEMQAYAWDLETNARNSSTFINPHKRDRTEGGPRKLTEMRDIYENNANAGSRRVRESILAVLPSWFVDEAIARCNDTLAKGGGVPLPQRIANSVKHFEGIGVTKKQLESKVGRALEEWTDQDLTELGIAFNSIKNGEITKESEFPQERVTAADITKPKGSPGKDAPAPQESAPPELTPEERREIEVKDFIAALNAAGIKNIQERKNFLTGRVKKAKPEDLTTEEMASVLDFIANGEPAE